MLVATQGEIEPSSEENGEQFSSEAALRMQSRVELKSTPGRGVQAEAATKSSVQSPLSCSCTVLCCTLEQPNATTTTVRKSESRS